MSRWPERTAEERFDEKVRRTVDGCWEWIGSRLNSGYGSFCHEGTGQPAHRVAYQLWVGNIPHGFHIDHLCRNRLCVNPSHLEAVTPRINALRIVGEDACRRGHPRSDENVYVGPDGKRGCRPCRSTAAREHERRRSRAA